MFVVIFFTFVFVNIVFVFLFFSIRVLSFYAYYPLCMYVFTYIYLLLVSYDLLFSRGYFTSSVSFTFCTFSSLIFLVFYIFCFSQHLQVEFLFVFQDFCLLRPPWKRD